MMSARRISRVLAATLAVLPSAVLAQSEERFGTDISATAGYSNNPFAYGDGDSGTGVIGLDILPSYQILTARSTATISGAINLQQYLRRYGRNDSYSGAVDYVLRPSERVTAHGRIDLSSAVIGFFNNSLPIFAGPGLVGTPTGVPGIVPITPGITPVIPTVGIGTVPLSDIGLFGFRNRRKLARASGDVSTGLSARDSLTVSGYAEAARYRGLQRFGDYEAYSGSLGYSRQVSERFNVGVRGSASFFNYRQANSDTRAYPVEATVSGRLSALWSINGALGVTFVDSDAIGSTRKTSLSGSVNLCRRGELSTMCFQAARSVSPTGLVGTQYVTSAGLNWSKQLSERENLSLGLSYSKIGGDEIRLIQNGVQMGGLPLQNEFAQGTVGYDRQISQRLRFIASANYSKLLGGNAGRPDNYGGQIGLSYHLGDVR